MIIVNWRVFNFHTRFYFAIAVQPTSYQMQIQYLELASHSILCLMEQQGNSSQQAKWLVKFLELVLKQMDKCLSVDIISWLFLFESNVVEFKMQKTKVRPIIDHNHGKQYSQIIIPIRHQGNGLFVTCFSFKY